MKFAIMICMLFSAWTAQGKSTDCANYAQYNDVPMAEMQKIVSGKKATIIDVNSDEMFKDSHIPGAIHYSTHQKKLAEVLPKDKGAMIVAYCGGKMCTAWQRAAKAACEMGYTNIKHFSHGITGWNKNNKG